MVVLVIHTREICYYSGAFFLHRMEDALERFSVKVKFLELSGEDSDFDILETLLQKPEEKAPFDAVLDINSKLPYLKLEDGSFFLDRLGVPFYNWIVDHPLYHHPGLVFPLQNYHVLCIDRAHRDYVRKYYPHIKSVEYLPIPGCRGTEEVKTTWEGVLLPLTYVSEGEIREEIAKLPNQGVKELVEELEGRWNPWEMPLETCLSQYLFENGQSPEDYGLCDFPELMNYLYPLDRLIRYRERLRFAQAAAETGLPLRIMGEGWEETSLSSYNNVEFLAPVPIALTYNRMAQVKVVLDVNPLFYEGVHDRVPSALANGAYVLSNMSERASENLKEETGVYYYHTEEELQEQMKRALGAPRVSSESMYLWEDCAKQFVAIVSNYNKI